MLHIASYGSRLGTPALLTSPAIQSKATSHQRVGERQSAFRAVFRRYTEALSAYNNRTRYKDGGSCLVNLIRLKVLIARTIDLYDHPKLRSRKKTYFESLLSEMEKKKTFYIKEMLRRPVDSIFGCRRRT
jgi:hypothetical protein